MYNNGVILLNYPSSIDYSYDNKGTIYPSTAVMMIGTLLKRKGYDVYIIDGAYHEDYLEILNSNAVQTNDNKQLYLNLLCKFSRVRLKYFFLKFPFEYWMHLIISRFYLIIKS